MAEEQDEDLVLQPADAGAAFRFEMAATNFFLGYWKHVLAVLVVGLVGFLIYGQYSAYVVRSQRAAASQIAEVERDIPPIALLSYQKATKALETSNEELIAAAQQLEAVAGATSGTASVEARLKAAELYRIAGDNEARRAALEGAKGTAPGLLGYSVDSALAALDLEAGNGDAAVKRFEELRKAHSGFLAQQATIELGLALEHLDRDSEAAKVYSEFLAKWPDSSRAGEVRDFQARVGAAG